MMMGAAFYGMHYGYYHGGYYGGYYGGCYPAADIGRAGSAVLVAGGVVVGLVASEA
jgi:hypothetical protein